MIALTRWLRLLVELRPDVVSIGTPKASFIGLFAARLTGVPHRIYKLRGLRLEGVSGVSRKILYWVEKFSASNATKIVAVSHSLMAKYLSLGITTPKKICVIGCGSSHGVDISHFESGDAEELRNKFPHLLEASQAGRPILGFVGRFSMDKGASTLLKCKQSLDRSGIDTELVLVGPCEDGEEFISAMNLSGRPVTFTGPVEDTAPFYDVIDILLLPTKREGFPNVVLEAGAAGVPVVATSVTGVIDAVLGGKTGILAPEGDDEAFIVAVITLLSRPAEGRTMGEHSKLWVARHFDHREVTRLHENFYNRLGSNQA